MAPHLILEDDGSARATARLRFGVSIAGVAGFAAVIVLGAPLTAALLSAGGALICLAVAARAAPAMARRERLELTPTALVLVRADELVVPWTDIADVTVDEERLDVLIHRHTGAPLRVTPAFGHLGAHALADRIRAAQPRST